MFATISEYIPNALYARRELADGVESALTEALRRGVDAHVVAEMLAVADVATTSGEGVGAEALITGIVQAQAQVRDNGYNPDVVVLSSADAVTITLARDEWRVQHQPGRVPELELEDDLLRRMDEAAELAGGMDRLAISPQCGFASVMLGNDRNEDAQWRKLELVGTVADRLWER